MSLFFPLAGMEKRHMRLSPSKIPAVLKPKRRWFQFSLRTVLLLMSVFALWLGIKTHRVRQQEDAIRKIAAWGGTAHFGYQISTNFRGDRILDPKALPPGPSWLRRIIGESYLRDVVEVSLRDTQVGDSELEFVEQLPMLESLDLSNTPVTSRGLVHIEKLRNLQGLYLINTDVDDLGLKHLARLTSLERLSLWNTQVGDAGVKHLSGLTNLRALVLDGTAVTDEGLKHLQGLTNLEEWLGLVDTQVTDAGLHNLKRLTKLKELNLLNTAVTADGVLTLKRDLKNTSISGPRCVGL